MLYASYFDKTSSANTFGASRTETNGTTAVTFVAAPGASTVRAITSLMVYNPNVAAVTLTLRLNDNSTMRTLWKGVLQSEETLEWTNKNGFTVVAIPTHTHSGLAPSGGTTNQVLTKSSGTDYAYAWADATLGVVYGEQELNCGVAPGTTNKTFTITSATCTAAKKLGAYIVPKATAEHTLDEHIVDPPMVFAHTPASGEFSITLATKDWSRLYGNYNVGWFHT